MLLFLSLLTVKSAEIGGSLRSNLRMSTNGEMLDFQDSLVFSPWWEAGDRALLHAGVEIRWSYPSQVDSLSDGEQAQLLQPFFIRPDDLWIRLRWANHQIKIGHQRVFWNIAPGYSLLNNLNAWDLRDPTQFDQRLSVPMLHYRANAQRWSAELAVVPWFTPAQLPKVPLNILPGAEQSFAIDGQPLDIRSTESDVSLPTPTIQNVQIGGRILYTAPTFDVSMSFFRGFDSLPQADGNLLLTGFQTDRDRVDVGIPLRHPRTTVVGFGASLQLPLESLGWIEVSYTIPEKTSLVASQEQLEALQTLGAISDVPVPLPLVVTQDGQPYPKWIIGVERFFGDVLFNAQWLHGFLTERQSSDLSNYAMLSANWSIRPTVQLQSSAAVNGQGLLLFNDVLFLVHDEVELGVGNLTAQATDDSPLSTYKNLQNFRIYASMQF